MSEATVVVPMPTRTQQLESMARGLPGMIEVLPGLYWTVPCPAEDPGRRAVIQWAGTGALQVSCICGTPGDVLAQALGVPNSALVQPQPSPTFVTVEEFMALTGKAQRWLLEPFVPAASLVLVQGAPKSGKTFFAGWLAVELARLGWRTLFVEEEGSVDVQGDRFRPFLPNVEALGNNLLVAFRKRFRLDVPARVDGLIKWVKDTRAQVVVLDPFKLLHQADEQSASELTPVLDALQRIITETGCSIVLIHHTKKGASWAKDDNAEAQSQDARGSGAIIGSVDHVIAIKGVPAAQRVAGQVRFIVECADSRVAQPFDKRQAVVTLTGGQDAMQFVDTKAAADRTEADLERALAVVPFEPQALPREALRKALQIGKAQMTKAVGLGIQTDVLREAPNKGLFRPRVDP